jgi:hypothetical protein
MNKVLCVGYSSLAAIYSRDLCILLPYIKHLDCCIILLAHDPSVIFYMFCNTNILLTWMLEVFCKGYHFIASMSFLYTFSSLVTSSVLFSFAFTHDLSLWSMDGIPASMAYALPFWIAELDLCSVTFYLLLHLTGLREWFSQSDENQVLPRIPVMANMAPPVPSKKGKKGQDNNMQTSLPMDQSRHSTMLDEESEEDELPEYEEFQLTESEQEVDKLQYCT